MRAAYADPPYLGLAEAFYGKMHPEASEYDKPETHRRLVERMMDEYDAWAMSLHEPAMREILAMCPKDVRVAAWVKPFASFKKNVTRAWTWEPVIFSFHRARKRTIDQQTWRDHIAEPISMMRGFPGAKPERFCFWVFEGLNLLPDDDFCDLFPGSGAVGRAWEKWRAAQIHYEQLELVPSNAEVSGAGTESAGLPGKRPMNMDGGKEHPTQKPVDLMAWCIDKVANAATVCDPFMGSGTTGVACAMLGKTFTGIERERKYFDLACERISRAQAQGQLLPPEQKPAAVQEALL